MSTILEGLRYAESHEYVKVEGEYGYVGITDYAQHELGNVVGVVTTGYNSISTGKSVCMAMLDIDYTKLGTEVAVRIRKKVFPGVVTKKRFYDKNYKK